MTNFPLRTKKRFFHLTKKKKKKRTNSLQIYTIRIHDNCHPNHEHVENIPPTIVSILTNKKSSPKR